MFEFTDSPLNSLAHFVVRFVLTRLLMNPTMKHNTVVNTNVKDEAIIPTNTASILLDFSTPADNYKQFYNCH